MLVVGVFDDGGKAADAVAALRRDRLGEVTVYGPTPHHAIDRALAPRVSPVRTYTLFGAVAGCAIGFALPIYTVLDWPLITGGKPLISIPPFVIIAFELMILCGAVAGFLGFLGLAGLPAVGRRRVQDTRFTNDRFGVVVDCDDSRGETVTTLLLASGAEEARHHA